jgi:hypothetical protein
MPIKNIINKKNYDWVSDYICIIKFVFKKNIFLRGIKYRLSSNDTVLLLTMPLDKIQVKLKWYCIAAYHAPGKSYNE